ncbi:MAG TPA: AI-2E family transporter [Longimicrobiaceae bacterium]|nr:AI-2E family transporter [Longimicrobiaceae bacterium]
MARSQPQPHSAPPVPPEAVAAHRPRDAGVRPRHLYQAAGLLFLLALAFRFFDTLARTFLVGYAAVILAVGLDAVRRRLPLQRRWFATAAGIAGVVTVVAVLWFGAPALLAQARSLAAMGPGLEAQLAEWEVALRASTGLNVDLPSPGGTLRLPGGAGDALGRAVGLVEILFIPVVVFFGALFALADPNQRLLTPVVRAVPPELRPAFYRILQLLGARLVGWLKGAALSMLAVGVLSITAFTVIGVPNGLLLGMLNGALEFMPLVRPWLGGGTATLVAFLHDPTQAIWTALAAVAIQQIEANLITPFAMAREAKIHPFVTLFALVLFGGMFGFLGLLLALPLVLLLTTVVQVLWVERALDTDGDRIRPVVEE